MTSANPVDAQRLETLLGRVVNDIGAAMNAALTVVGDQLGLYRALAESDGLSPEQLAERTGTQPRYLREWLSAQAASGYVTYAPETERFSLTPEQAAAFADEGSPAFVPGGFQVAQAVTQAIPRAVENFKTGSGMGWGEHASCLFHGTERFFRSAYLGNLTTSWLPALDGVVQKLEAGGATVADVGCGLGASTLLMAQTYPRSRFIGFDAHPRSIEIARERAARAGLAGRVQFEVALATDFPGNAYDLVAHFDSLHDMGDPVGAARHVRHTLAPGGSWMIVEPFSADRLEDNLNPVSRVYYAASTMLCVPASLADGNPGLALGAQAGEARLRRVVGEAGFERFRRATQTPFNLVFEARA